MESKVVWKDGMAFEAQLEGFSFGIDADPEFGGQGFGPKPKGLVLTALCGCTAMDVISILTKMRVPVKSFSVDASTELAETHPKVFGEVVVNYRFEGDDLPEAKLRRAVELSTTTYCAVNAMLGKATTIRHALWVNGELLDEEPVG